MTKKYKIGLDISSIGYFVILEGNKIIDLHQVPQKKSDTKDIMNQITQLKKDAKIRGNKTKCEKEIKALQNQILSQPRNTKEVFEWLSKYKDDIEIVNIEKPLLQTMNASSINAIAKMFEYLGIVTAMLDILEIPYNIISISEWRSKFDYNKMDKADIETRMKETRKTKTEITREFAKLESIRIAEERVSNIKDYYIPKGCKNISSDIVESAILGLV